MFMLVIPRNNVLVLETIAPLVPLIDLANEAEQLLRLVSLQEGEEPQVANDNA